LDRIRGIPDDGLVSSTLSAAEAPIAPVRVVPPVDGIMLLFMAAVGAASLSLRALLDAVARTAFQQRQEPAVPSQLAFVGLGFGLAAGRSVAHVTAGALRATDWAMSLSLDAVPAVLRAPVGERVKAIRERERGRQRALSDAESLAEHLVNALIPRIASALLDELDLTALIEDRVDVDRIVSSVDLDAATERINLDAIVQRIDLNAVAERIDVDAVAARLDVEAVVDRLDLAALARTVIDEIDLPEIIRRSTGVVASETVRGVRMQGIDADRAIAGFVDRMLGRTPRRRDAEPADEGTGTENGESG
jgi:hypothetical protein